MLPILKYTVDFKKSFILGILLAFLASVLKMMAPDNIRQIMDYLQDNVNGTYDFGIVKRYAITAGVFIVSKLCTQQYAKCHPFHSFAENGTFDEKQGE